MLLFAHRADTLERTWFHLLIVRIPPRGLLPSVIVRLATLCGHLRAVLLPYDYRSDTTERSFCSRMVVR